MSLIDRALAATVERHRLHADLEQQGLERLAARKRYALDPLALLDAGHVRIWDKERREIVVYQPYPYQRQAHQEWIDVPHLQTPGGGLRFHNTLVEKSRQTGLTWIFAYGAWWAVNYHTAQGFVRARKSSEVDDGGQRSTWRSFLGKIRFIYRHLPDPEHVGRCQLRFVGGHEPKVVNADRPESFLLGEGETPDAGRGGTFMFSVLDETAFIAHGEKVHGALSLACPDGRAYLSTANGRGNVFHRLVSAPPAGWRKLRVHWSEHPVYSAGLHIAATAEGPAAQPTPETAAAAAGCDLCAGTQAGVPYDPRRPGSHRYPGRLTSPWYEREIADKTDEQVAQELDIDYEASTSARVFPEASRDQHLAAEAIPLGPAGVSGLELAIDYGLDCTAVVICQDTPGEYQTLGYLKLADHTPDQVSAALRQRLAEIGVPAEHLTPAWTSRIHAVGDPAGEGRELSTGRTTAAEYGRLGWSILSYPRSVEETIRAVKRLLRGIPKRLVVSPAHGGEEFLDDVIANRWPTDRTGARKLGATRPLDDSANHGARAFAYLCREKFPPPAGPDAGRGPDPDGDPAAAGVIDPGVRYGMTL